jgi:hypothetical protein
MTITAESTTAGTVKTTTAESRARARDFLTVVIGSQPDDLCWDEIHQLQGHAHVDGQELVVIAARDELHRPVVLIAADWEEIRRNAQSRRTILDERAIADRAHLTAALAAGRAPLESDSAVALLLAA